jgi:hypothetical protein
VNPEAFRVESSDGYVVTVDGPQSASALDLHVEAIVSLLMAFDGGRVIHEYGIRGEEAVQRIWDAVRMALGDPY